MAQPNTSEKSNALDREENITKGNVSAKKVALYTYDAGNDILQPFVSSGGATSEKQEQQIDILNDINDSVAILSAVRGTSADLRVTLLGGTTAVTGTLTGVTTVATVTNQAQMGGIQANQQVPAITNIAAQANINNVSVT